METWILSIDMTFLAPHVLKQALLDHKRSENQTQHRDCSRYYTTRQGTPTPSAANRANTLPDTSLIVYQRLGAGLNTTHALKKKG